MVDRGTGPPGGSVEATRVPRRDRVLMRCRAVAVDDTIDNAAEQARGNVGHKHRHGIHHRILGCVAVKLDGRGHTDRADSIGAGHSVGKGSPGRIVNRGDRFLVRTRATRPHVGNDLRIRRHGDRREQRRQARRIPYSFLNLRNHVIGDPLRANAGRIGENTGLHAVRKMAPDLRVKLRGGMRSERRPNDVARGDQLMQVALIVGGGGPFKQAGNRAAPIGNAANEDHAAAHKPAADLLAVDRGEPLARLPVAIAAHVASGQRLHFRALQFDRARKVADRGLVSRRRRAGFGDDPGDLLGRLVNARHSPSPYAVSRRK